MGTDLSHSSRHTQVPVPVLVFDTDEVDWKLADNKYRDFTREDVVRCFNLRNEAAAGMRISRLMKDHVIEKLPGFVENGTTKGKFRKTGVIMLS